MRLSAWVDPLAVAGFRPSVRARTASMLPGVGPLGAGDRYPLRAAHSQEARVCLRALAGSDQSAAASCRATGVPRATATRCLDGTAARRGVRPQAPVSGPRYL